MEKCKKCGAEFDENLREFESDLCFSCLDQELHKPENVAEGQCVDDTDK